MSEAGPGVSAATEAAAEEDDDEYGAYEDVGDEGGEGDEGDEGDEAAEAAEQAVAGLGAAAEAEACAGPTLAAAAAGPSATPVTARADGLRLLMASARVVWAKPKEPPPPPPPPRDAFDALMRASAAPGPLPHGGGTGGGGGGGGTVAAGGKGRGRGGRSAAGRGGGGRGGGGPRWLQPFKRIEDTPFVVDGFTCGAKAGDVHFLSHFHSDHYVGLTPSFGAKVYASAVTAALVVRRLGLPSTQLVVLPIGGPTEVSYTSTDGLREPLTARVTLIDANHCPGAVLLLFQASSRQYTQPLLQPLASARSPRRSPRRAALPAARRPCHPAHGRLPLRSWHDASPGDPRVAPARPALPRHDLPRPEAPLPDAGRRRARCGGPVPAADGHATHAGALRLVLDRQGARALIES